MVLRSFEPDLTLTPVKISSPQCPGKTMKGWAGNLKNLVHHEVSSKKNGERFSDSASLTDLFDLKNLCVRHEILAAGRRASTPHTHSHQEEMIVVLKGNPTVHLGGEVRVLSPGDFIGFAPGKDLHFIENKTTEEVHFLLLSAKSELDHVLYPEVDEGKQGLLSFGCVQLRDL